LSPNEITNINCYHMKDYVEGEETLVRVQPINVKMAI